ncbi:hypothetical protein [Dokdonia sp. PRO95]|uniref:hypothetical protein n=1 Tax=Dokdonia sp. PRO95 TaxID=1239415 RepID=UPI00054ED9A2|nr:hypothetical protein [Dokdonia sp. PRO95]
MKTRNITIIALLIASFTVASCRETEVKETTVVKEVQVETEKEREGILERAAKKVDNKVNEEINEEIEKIGDDN